MFETKLTSHATTRLPQRGFRNDDVDLIQQIGTAVEDGFIVRKSDCSALQQELKRLSDRIGRLSGARVVVVGGNVLTVYRAEKATERRLLRKAEDRELHHPYIRCSTNFDLSRQVR
jgi:RNA-binding protein YhbY